MSIISLHVVLCIQWNLCAVLYVFSSDYLYSSSSQGWHNTVIHIFCLYCSELKQIAEQKEVPHTLEAYIKKLANCRRRVHLVNELLRSIQVNFNLVGLS